MTQIEPIRLDSGAVIYIETTAIPPKTEPPERRQRQSKDLSTLAYSGVGTPPIAIRQTIANDNDSTPAIEQTIRDYADAVLGAY